MPVAIRRYHGTGPSRSSVDTATTGFIKNYDSSELIGIIEQGDQVAIVLVETLTAILPVTISDKLVIDDAEFAIKNVKIRRDGTTLIALEIHAKG